MPTYHTFESLGIKALERNAERGDYPRFTVVVDGERIVLKSRRSLDRLLGNIYSDAPRVFRNAGKGITIDFDS